ncbi:carbonic anhydrase [Rhizobium sp. CSW-27]|uniref:carbonic anhydrase n=1 Tax=Rhizobium sp. CSW-27 TaxID=2839985 RepID=UPI001C01DCA8|nr:carbonic anhydrase [Rhizobium sp. CSW-27]MBT9368346.1 carbonic anhydrase [Rhizobium sp. CSW-27]
MCITCLNMSRRGFFRLATGATLGLGALSTAGLGLVRPAAAATTLTPDQALEKLKAGNLKYQKAPEVCVADMARTRETVAKGQSPWAVVLACADSRVAPELVFGGAALGDLFVCRNAGNMADTATMGSIEYAVEHLGTPLILVLGHERCGAVSAACEIAEKGTKLPGSIGPMVEAIVPAALAMRGKEGDFIDNTVRENARLTAQKIAAESPIVAELVHHGKVRVVHGRYDLDSGAVDFLG